MPESPGLTSAGRQRYVNFDKSFYPLSTENKKGQLDDKVKEDQSRKEN
jgi:hypothetical protein